MEMTDVLKRALIPVKNIGIYVQDVASDKVLLSVNPAFPFNPASTMKLVTSNAALELLGPAFTWKTQAYANGIQAGDVLQGDLIIKGSGDPKLVIENFWLFLRQIRAKGIREITGNLILDHSVFEDAIYDPAGFDGDPAKPYNANADGLLLNYKVFGVRFIPDTASGLVNVAIDPPVADYPVIAPKLTHDDCGDWHGKLRGVIDGRSANFGNGQFSVACGEKSWYVHPYQMSHAQYAGIVFRQLWRDLGGSFKGKVTNGIVPQSARLVTQWESVTLPEVIRDMNKYSNNVMARQLLLTLAAESSKSPGSAGRGAQVIRSWLADKGIPVADLVIENGSGLSRIERISALAMGRMLVAAFQSPIMPEFMSSLPLAGYDGTMRQRLKSQTAAGHAHIKTGSLNEVRTLAGYILAASGRRYAVVYFINDRNAVRGQEAQDALLQWIYEKG
jgi:serine-type D-Ala-D-Ala carboxypeptidase/endopeptidase (penicillin-binding protein 4)